MSEFVIELPQPATLPVRGTESLFPVRRVYCIGRKGAALVRREYPSLLVGQVEDIARPEHARFTGADHDLQRALGHDN